MAELGSESSVAISSSTPSWWDLRANPRSSSSFIIKATPWHPLHNSSSNSTCEDISINSNSYGNPSNHSSLSVHNTSRELVESASSVTELSGETASENHLWNQILLSVETSGSINNSHQGRENFLDALSSKTLTTEMFEPACDFLKKLDNCWELPTNSMPLHDIEKQLNTFDHGSLIDQERINMSDLVSNWSIAPPDPQQSRKITPTTCNISLSSSMDRYSESNFPSQMRQDPSNSEPFSGVQRDQVGNGNMGYISHYNGHQQLKRESHEFDGMESSEAEFLRSYNSGNGLGLQMGLKNSLIGDSKKCQYEMSDMTCSSNARTFSDLISFSGYLSRPFVDFHHPKPCLRSHTISPDCKKQGDISSSSRANGRVLSSEGKKKRCEDNSETLFKKPRNDSSTTSLKIQAPKVKLGDKITALQQIVSPFGKTDTASVLQEAIGYINFLQEQVQLLSNPYVKSGANKDHSLWGGLERKEKSETKLDLKSRGLCLVPIACTPQIYRENTGPDYWTPTYRGGLYR